MKRVKKREEKKAGEEKRGERKRGGEEEKGESSFNSTYMWAKLAGIARQ